MAKEKVISTYQLKITLRGIKPLIWRRFVVPAAVTLPKLHLIIQEIMGWTDSHLHEFSSGTERYGIPDLEWPSDAKNEARVRLNRVLSKEKQKLLYLYDFGDSWEHVIELEKILVEGAASTLPKCIAGKRACPPEDCGGIYGYHDLLKVIKDPENPEYESMIEWLGGKFDPEYFDKNEVNEVLANLMQKPV